MLLEDHHLSLIEWTELPRGIRLGTGGSVRVSERGEDGPLVRVSLAVQGEGQIVLELPLGDAAGYWNPGLSGGRGLPADWAGRDAFSAVRSAPIGALYDADGSSRLAFGFDCLVHEGELQYGVSEEEKTFVVRLPIEGRLAELESGLDLVVVGEAMPYARAIRAVSEAVRADLPVRPASSASREPVYSTWYAHSQRISEQVIEADVAVAAELGCRSVFIDDGWQRFGDGRWYAGCGDWVPDPVKFPDLAALSGRLHAQGLDVVLWIAPLLLGEQSEAFDRLHRFAPHYSEALRTRVLDPRHPEVRASLIETCARLVRDYDLDGLKIDFLNSAMVYAGEPSTGDIADVGEAMTLLLRGVADAVDLERPGALIEFRQPYVSPAVASYADVVRADDCPADAVQNRRSILDLRLLANGQIVHADPIMWDPTAPSDAPVRQLFGAFFGVPQISMPLVSLPAAHRAEVAAVLRVWRELRDVLLDGEITAGLPIDGYQTAAARLGDTLLVVAYGASILDLDLDGVRRLVVLNASGSGQLAYRSSASTPATAGLTVLTGEARGVESISVELTAQGFLPVPPWSIAELAIG
ncbi:alpha-galactosidase [Agromyces cerinus]|uniref:glycoside hydrolase family 36 protein n=1 Tax=Agromyces cerinus TaxID=33878 RepID=UPI00195BD416|nr:glycoside hydrolase family 36 protein [Agromyces cerinus]MBM7829921.1 alpha-galactosidase [Agromyces cerinus]